MDIVDGGGGRGRLSQWVERAGCCASKVVEKLDFGMWFARARASTRVGVVCPRPGGASLPCRGVQRMEGGKGKKNTTPEHQQTGGVLEDACPGGVERETRAPAAMTEQTGPSQTWDSGDCNGCGRCLIMGSSGVLGWLAGLACRGQLSEISSVEAGRTGGWPIDNTGRTAWRVGFCVPWRDRVRRVQQRGRRGRRGER